MYLQMFLCLVCVSCLYAAMRNVYPSVKHAFLRAWKQRLTYTVYTVLITKQEVILSPFYRP